MINKKPDATSTVTICFNGSNVSPDDWKDAADAAIALFTKSGAGNFIAKRKDDDKIIEFILNPEAGVSRANGVLKALQSLQVPTTKVIFVIGYDADPALDAGIAPVLIRNNYVTRDISVGAKAYGHVNYATAQDFKENLLYPALGINPTAVLAANAEKAPVIGGQ